jgi:eukaryotic-like serine/threonine-protein kinase
MRRDAAWSVPGYVAEEMIGFGGSGEVWRGRAVASGETVALKRLRLGASVEERSGLRREGALLAALDHPHLLRVREVVTTDRDAVLVLDHAAGGSLAMLLRSRITLPPGEVVSVLAPLAAALAYAHSEGLCHGDVTPANVLFTEEGRPLLADLGVARVLGELEAVHSTPEYIDPAVAAGAAPGPASDVFMVAAVAVHALTGAPPWRADDAEAALALAATGRVPDLPALAPGLPEALTRVLARALSAQPHRRGTAAEFALDLRHACGPAPVRLAVPAPPGGRTGVGRSGSGTSARSGAAAVAGGPAALTHAVRPGRPAPTAAPDPARRPRRRLIGRRGDRAAGRHAVAGQGSARRRASLPIVVAGVVGLVLALVAGVAWGAAGPGDRPASVTGPGGPSAASAGQGAGGGSRADARRWLGVLDRLDAARAGAYERGDARLLDRVYAAGPHLSADAARLRALVAAGYTARGVRHRFGAVTVLQADAKRVRLRVEQWLPPSRRMRDGRVAGEIPGTTPAVIVVDLVATPAGWRLA